MILLLSPRGHSWCSVFWAPRYQQESSRAPRADEDSGASLLGAQTDGAGSAQSGEEKAEREFHRYIQRSPRWVPRVWCQTPFSGDQLTEEEQWP